MIDCQKFTLFVRFIFCIMKPEGVSELVHYAKSKYGIMRILIELIFIP